MADRSKFYGLKEVADVDLFPVGTRVTVSYADGKVTLAGVKDKEGDAGTEDVKAAYSFDTLKVTNIEVTSEQVSARGGKGNPELISWSYGKEVNFTMEDALLSMDTLDLMFGASESGADTTKSLTIDANTFPDSYLLIGQTVMRSYQDGTDHPFLFVMPKAQIQVGGTLTMEAEGDPSTFEMTVKALSASCKFTGDPAARKDVLVQFINLDQITGDYVINVK